MAEASILNDATFEAALETNQPLLLVVHGDDLRGDFNAQFNKAVEANPDVRFARIALAENPKAAAHFKANGKSVLVALYQGATIVRRKKPWGSDVPLAVEMLQSAAKADSAPAADLESPDPAAPTSTPDEPLAENAKEQAPMETTPVDITDETFQEAVIDYELPVVVDFWAPWCGPCKMVAPILDKLAAEYSGKVRVAKVNVDENPGLAQYFQIMSIPTMMMLKERTIVFNQPGALPEPALRDLFDQLIALEIPPRDQAEEAEEEEAADEPSN